MSIPQHLIDRAASAIYQASVFGDEFALDAWRDMPEDAHIKTGTREFATAALEAVAADLWAEGAHAMIDGHNTTWINDQNPYRGEPQ